jgi:hypothetical protein
MSTAPLPQGFHQIVSLHSSTALRSSPYYAVAFCTEETTGWRARNARLIAGRQIMTTTPFLKSVSKVLR